MTKYRSTLGQEEEQALQNRSLAQKSKLVCPEMLLYLCDGDIRNGSDPRTIASLHQ